MKTPRHKLLLTALVGGLGIAMLITPALAQPRQPSRHERMSQSPDYATPYARRSDTPYYGNAPYDQRDDW